MIIRTMEGNVMKTFVIVMFCLFILTAIGHMDNVSREVYFQNVGLKINIVLLVFGAGFIYLASGFLFG
jgi:hypothetical protein